MRDKTFFFAAWIVALVLMSMLAGPPDTVEAATLVVDSTADSSDDNPGNGTCATSGGQCTLRAAIEEANAQAGDDAITLPAGTYTLSLGSELVISSNVTLNGAGAKTTIIQAAAASGSA